MSKLKYALFPGFVMSKTDGQRHFINAHDLAKLYGVRMNECIVIDLRYSDSVIGRGNSLKDLIHLHPLYNENYIDAKELI